MVVKALSATGHWLTCLAPWKEGMGIFCLQPFLNQPQKNSTEHYKVLNGTLYGAHI